MISDKKTRRVTTLSWFFLALFLITAAASGYLYTQNQVLQSQNRSLQSQVSTLQSQVSSLQSELLPQPDIQITQAHFDYTNTPDSSIVDNYGYIAYDRINLPQPFDVTANSSGAYGLVFDNTLSSTLTEQVSVTYAYPGQSNTTSFQIGPGEVKIVEANLTSGEKFSGTFTVSGGILDDTVKVSTEQTTCQEMVSYSYVLVNGGSAGGFATVGLQTNQTIGSNKYFVNAEQQSPESGSVTIPQPFCSAQQTTLVILSQQKG